MGVNTSMGAKAITITLPLPAKELSPNSRCHWRPKSVRVKAYRLQACIAARIASGLRAMNWDAADVRLQFYFADRRKRDRDNYLASMKSAMDGLADAKVIVNDHGFTYLPVVMDYDKLNPRVVVTVSPAANERSAT